MTVSMDGAAETLHTQHAGDTAHGVQPGQRVHGRPQGRANNPSGTFQLFRIGDAVSARNTHAAIYDALRLVKDL